MLSNAGGIIAITQACGEVQSLRVFLQEVAGESGVFGVSDDQNRQSKRICSLLCKVPDQTLLESELKRQLGFKYAPLCSTQSQNRQSDSSTRLLVALSLRIVKFCTKAARKQALHF